MREFIEAAIQVSLASRALAHGGDPQTLNLRVLAMDGAMEKLLLSEGETYDSLAMGWRPAILAAVEELRERLADGSMKMSVAHNNRSDAVTRTGKIIEGHPFDWEGAKEASDHVIDAHGEVNWKAASMADPGVTSCPDCGEYHWAEGVILECGACSSHFYTHWRMRQVRGQSIKP